MKKLIKSFFVAAILLFVFTFTSNKVEAATFSLNPSSQTVNSGDQFNVTLSVDPQSKQVSSLQATLGFPSNLLQVQSVNFTGLFPSNDQNTDNSNGILKLGSNEVAGGTYIQSSSNWVTITFKATGSGTATLNFTCPSGSAIYELGSINNLLSCTNLPQGSYSISSSGSSSGSTPTPTPVSASCNSSAPAAPANLTATTGTNNGEVILKWVIPAGASNYNVIFGNHSGSYQYGATNIGNVSTYSVKSLVPGQLYYFEVSATNGCASSGFSNEASARAKASGSSKTVQTGTTTTASTYKSIGEVLPEAIQPTITPEPVITVTPVVTITPAPKTSESVPFYIYILAGLALLIIIIIVALLFTGRSKGEELPPINVNDTNQPLPPSGSGTGGNVNDPNVINQPQNPPTNPTAYPPEDTNNPPQY